MIPEKANLALLCILVPAFLAQLLLIPLVLQEQKFLMAAFVFLMVPLNTPFWSLIHEAIHRNLHSRRALNEFLGRLSSIIFGASFHVLRFGHLMHHQYNRAWESEYYDSRTQKKWIVCLHHYFKMLGGLYITEVLTSFLLALLPGGVARKISRKIFQDEKHYQAVCNALFKPDIIRKIRIDCLLIVMLYAGCFYLYRDNPGVLAVFLAGRALVISLMDNAYHYGTPRDNSVPAKELQVPRPLAAFVLNFNYHLTHHKDTRLPWNLLATHHDFQKNSYSQKLLPALLVQFRGPRDVKRDSIPADS